MVSLKIPIRDWPWIGAYLLLTCLLFGMALKAQPSESEVLFTFIGQDDKVGYIRPYIVHDWGVTLDSGNRAIAKGDLLLCKPKNRVQELKLADGSKITVSELLLVCKNPDRVLVVKGPIFP